SVRHRLEIDHVDGWALTKVTTLDRLARLCRWHHHQKTYCGYRLEGGPGAWRWCGPAPPEDAGPAPPDQATGELLFAG
ncbi:MAG: HNH endonuclease signature motif containing protein, partial [Acidimicrobiales bacterium]